jgi:N-acetylglucosamine kinase-like BadF-type ATPase
MGYIIGIDQGSTKTLGAISDEKGSILALSRTGGAEHHSDGLPVQVGYLEEVLKDLLKKASVKPEDVKLIFGGLTGVDWPEENELFEKEILKLGICNKVYIENDTLVALRGGTSNSYGAILCAGTGSNCAVISPDGRKFTYGFFIDDDLQGGGSLGRRVLTTVYRAYTGLEAETLLVERVKKKFAIEDIEKLKRMDALRKLDVRKIHSLAIDLFEAAYQGDEISVKIIKWFGVQLASLVNARARLFGMTDMEFEVVVSGSVFKGPGTLLTDVVTAEIHGVCPRARIVNARYEPVVGAVLFALEKLHGSIGEELATNIETSCRKLGLLRLPEVIA